ncbi:MAG: glycosyltransferase [Flavobacteriaceae bacterium]
MIALLLVYFFSLITALLILYSGYQLYLSLVCSQQLKAQRLQSANSQEPARLADESLPLVTFQIALFNEGHVVDTLFSSLLKINYPKQLLEIQLLDDSTDASIEINAEWVRRFNAFGFEAVHLRRQHRKGFKAGALNEGLKKAKGAYIALFDADFNLDPNWLVRSLEGFEEPSIAAVQSRWTYSNATQNRITQLQVLGLNHHFINEHIARDHLNLMSTFNGTAALWKKSVIEQIGGFSTQTLTEDLNLAYRAQLEGYHISYAAHITAESELPATASAYFTQQFRWNKGAAENFRLLRARLSRLRNGSVRFHAFMHLLGSTFYFVSFLFLIIGL